MSKWIPRSIASVYNAIAKLNANFQDIANIFDRVLFRDGTAPNSMSANLDMNHNRVVNLADAIDPTDAVTFNQFLGGVALHLPTIGAGTLLANTSLAAGQPVETNITDLQPYFSTFSTGQRGFVPSSPGGTTTFLCADGVWRTPATNVGSVSWGSVLGTISSQSDLVAALAAKANVTTPSFLQNIGISDATAPATYLTKIGANAGTAVVYNDGNLHLQASSASIKAIDYLADVHQFLVQDGTTQLVTIDNGGDLTLKQNQRALKFTDVNGDHPLFQCQVDNNFVFFGTDTFGGARAIFGVGMHSGTSTFNFSITATGVTPAAADNSTKLATTAFVQGEIANKLGAFSTVSAFTADFTVANANANTYMRHTSSSAHTITLNSTPTVGCALVVANRGSGVVNLSCSTGIYKNGASSTSTTGVIAAGGVVQLFHEGAGVWVASGDGLT